MGSKQLENPREKASVFSVLTFYWTFGLFRKGYSKVLELEDLVRPLNADRSERLGNLLSRQVIYSPSNPISLFKISFTSKNIRYLACALRGEFETIIKLCEWRVLFTLRQEKDPLLCFCLASSARGISETMPKIAHVDLSVCVRASQVHSACYRMCQCKHCISIHV